MLDNVEKLTNEELDYRYRYNLYRTLKNLEKDIDQISGQENNGRETKRKFYKFKKQNMENL